MAPLPDPTIITNDDNTAGPGPASDTARSGPIDDLATAFDKAIEEVKANSRNIRRGYRFVRVYQGEAEMQKLPADLLARLDAINTLTGKEGELTEDEAVDLAAHCAAAIRMAAQNLAAQLLPIMGRDLMTVLSALRILV